jgi:outer membrane protein TolC
VNDPTRRGWRVELRWSPPRPWDLISKRQEAEALIAQADADLAEQALGLSATVRAEHATLASLEREEGIIREAIDTRQQIVQAVTSRVAQGNGTRLDVLAAQAALSEARGSLTETETARASSEKRLRALLALPATTSITVHEEPARWAEPRDAAELEQASLAARPALKASVAKHAQQAQVAARARYERLPWFRLVAAPRVGVQPGIGRTSVDVNFELMFPLWNWNEGGIASEEAKLKQVSERFGADLAEVRRDIVLSVQELAGQRRVIELHEKELLPALEARVEAARGALKQGQVDILSLLLAEDALVLARRNLERAGRQFRLAWIALERTVGAPIER